LWILINKKNRLVELPKLQNFLEILISNKIKYLLTTHNFNVIIGSPIEVRVITIAYPLSVKLVVTFFVPEF
jgi:hypothetical protein